MSLKQKFLFWFIPRIGRMFIQLIGRTIPFREVSSEFVQEHVFKNRENVIFCFWHNRLFFLAYYFSLRLTFRGHPATVLISSSRDGEYITRAIQFLKGDVVRGSSTRGGVKGIITLLKRIRDKYSTVITLDGPKGPKYEVKSGIMLLAQKSGLPIVPVTYAVNNAYVFKKSWDNFVLPYPCSKIAVIYGEPLWVRTEDDKKKKMIELQGKMDELTKIAENYFGRN